MLASFPTDVEQWSPLTHLEANVEASLSQIGNSPTTIFYDTIYALQDIKDDFKAKVNSAAVTHSRHIKLFLVVLAVLQNSLFTGVGVAVHLSASYYLTTCVGSFLLQVMIAKVLKVEDLRICFWWFTHGSYIMAGTIATGFLYSAF